MSVSLGGVGVSLGRWMFQLVVDVSVVAVVVVGVVVCSFETKN